MFTKDPEIGAGHPVHLVHRSLEADGRADCVHAQISLHSRRVMVKKHADGVIPKWLHWMKAFSENQSAAVCQKPHLSP